MAKNSVAEWDESAAANTDVGGISIIGNAAVSNFDNALREVMAQIKMFSETVTTQGEHLQGYIYGLTLSNNVIDPTNDIDIAAGSAGSDGAPPTLMTLGSSITKRLDAVWSVGSGNGGLDTGSAANNTYHIWLIRRSDTGVVDALFSTSATSPAMPASYDQKRRIGTIVRSSGVINAFAQHGDVFDFKTRPTGTAALTTSASTLTLDGPTGLPILIKLIASVDNASILSSAMISSLEVDDYGVGLGSGNVGAAATGASTTQAYNEIYVRTNTSCQVRGRSGANPVTLSYSIAGWVDTRGRD